MNKQKVLFLTLTVLFLGSFLGSYLKRNPFAVTIDRVEQAHLLIDEARGDQNKLALASDLLREELNSNPNNLFAIFLEGRTLQQRGLIEAALESYKKYFNLKVSTDYAANYNAGELSELKGDLAGAERYFLAAIGAAPNETAAWERLIRLLLKQNRSAEAKQYFATLNQKLPSSNVAKNLAALMVQ